MSRLAPKTARTGRSGLDLWADAREDVRVLRASTIAIIVTSVLSLHAAVVSAEQLATVAPGAFDDPAIWQQGRVPGPGDAASVRHRVWVRSDLHTDDIFVRRGGSLLADGPFQLTVPGAIVAQDGAALALHGSRRVELGVLSSVEEALTEVTLEDDQASWTPGALVGAVVIIRGGLARTWRFTVTGNTSTRLTAALPYANKAVEVQGAHPRDPAALDVDAGVVRDRREQLLGRFVRSDRGVVSRIVGALDIAGGPDQLILWPAQSPAPSSLMTTYGLTAGDRYSIHAPVTLRTGLLYVSGSARASVRRAQIEGGFVQVERATGFELLDSEMFGADPGCFVLARDVSATRIVGNFIHDVSADSDLVQFGGRYRETQQRGHGICLYGTGHVIADNLLTNLNDDMIYVGASADVLIRGNVALGSGVYHGNSYEAITAFQVAGPLRIEGNVAGGAQLSLLLEDRSGAAIITSNLFLQDHGRAVVADRSGDGADTAEYVGNVFLGSAAHAVTLQAQGAPASFVGNYFHDVTLRDPLLAESNLFRGTRRIEQAMVRDPVELVSNLFLLPAQRANRVAVVLGESSGQTWVTGNSFDVGSGAAVRHEAGAGEVTYEANLTVGAMFGRGTVLDAPALIGNVVVDGVLAEHGARVTDAGDTVAVDVRWAQRPYLVPECDPVGAGFRNAGVADAGAVPLGASRGYSERWGATTAAPCTELEEVVEMAPEPRSAEQGCGVARTWVVRVWRRIWRRR